MHPLQLREVGAGVGAFVGALVVVTGAVVDGAAVGWDDEGAGVDGVGAFVGALVVVTGAAVDGAPVDGAAVGWDDEGAGVDGGGGVTPPAVARATLMRPNP